MVSMQMEERRDGKVERAQKANEFDSYSDFHVL